MLDISNMINVITITAIILLPFKHLIPKLKIKVDITKTRYSPTTYSVVLYLYNLSAWLILVYMCKQFENNIFQAYLPILLFIVPIFTCAFMRYNFLILNEIPIVCNHDPKIFLKKCKLFMKLA